MKKVITTISATLMLLFATIIPVGNVSAINLFDDVCDNNPTSEICQNQNEDESDIVKNVVDALLYVVGIISVVMIIVGGIKYAVSGGNATAVTNAKNTILYAVIGLVVSFAAYAVVRWVLIRL